MSSMETERYLAAIDAWTDATAERDKLRHALNQLVSYALTAKSHSPAWLEGMAAKINAAAELLGDADRAEVCGEGLRIRRGEPED